jgi:hypothetical protein
VEKKKHFKYIITFLALCLAIHQAQAQQQLLPLSYQHRLNYEKHLYARDKKPFHTAVKPYLASEVYERVYPDSTYGLKKINATTGFQKAVNIIGYEDIIRFDEKGFIKPTYMDSSAGVSIEKNRTEKYYVPRKFYISANPILRLEVGRDFASSNNLYYNLRGAEINASIGSKVSVYSAFLENQAEFPDYVTVFVRKTRAAPGEGKVRNFGANGFDFSRAMGHISYTPSKHFNVQFGNGKHFIGDGYRSLLLSDNAFVYPYLKFSTQFWRIKYTNIYTEFTNDVQSPTDFTLGLPRKLGSFNYLSIDAAPWLEIGVFEGIVWRNTTSDGNKTFDPNFLNPIIGIRALQKNLDANSVYGLNMSVTLPKQIVLYGQLMLNQLEGDLKSSTYRTGFQAGAKYFDVFGIPNLNLLAEYNRVRPYSYQSNVDTVLHYSHYNQALAHPMGANFDELLIMVNYRYKRLVAELKFNTSVSAIDAPILNVGSDILLNAANDDFEFVDNSTVGQGELGYRVFNTEARIGYIINPKLNMMIEARLQVRNYNFDLLIPNLTTETRMFTIGFNTRLFNHYYDTPVNF